MAGPSVDPNTGFCKETKSFHSLRPCAPLPPETLPLSFPSFALSLLPSPLPSSPALIDATNGSSLSYPSFISQFHSLCYSLHTRFNLLKGDVAFILSPSRLHIPVLYYSLLSVGVIVCPTNVISTPSEISSQINLVKPSIVFATSNTKSKLPPNINTLLLDSPEFDSLLITNEEASSPTLCRAVIQQTDIAAILFSSGTTGRAKAAMISHRSFIARIAGFYALRSPESPEVMLLLAPMVHTLGFIFALKGFALGETTIVMNRPGFAEMLGAVERYKTTLITLAPPIVGALVRSDEVRKFDLRALKRVICGGAAMPEKVAVAFFARFPHVELQMGYGATETGGISRMINHEECKNLRSVGRLSQYVEAKVADEVTAEALSVGQQGELWVRGPSLMTGYLDDIEANVSTFGANGWLKTGDLCYFDNNGFLYVVGRLKELIKYKAYQVSPAELEHVLHSIPDVVDAAVIPFPQEAVGEIPMAFVVKQPGSNLSEQQIIDNVANQVAPYKKIRKVTFLNSIPKSATGKILRKELSRVASRGSNPTSSL